MSVENFMIIFVKKTFYGDGIGIDSALCTDESWWFDSQKKVYIQNWNKHKLEILHVKD